MRVCAKDLGATDTGPEGRVSKQRDIAVRTRLHDWTNKSNR